jgi:penicillin-insensitive murein endopeptidase
LTAALAALCLCSTLAPTAQSSEWSQIDAPSEGAPRAIGQTNNGCIAGAHALPLEGAGYQVMHIERNRFYGHPQLVQTIEILGRKVEAHGLGLLQVGDLGQPRGGPMSFGHRSHQTGLDVDIWYNLDPKIPAAANLMRSDVNAPSMLNGAKKGLNRSAWKQAHLTLLELAANLPAVDRIFVNPYIKKELCEKAEGERGWLRKIRPWYYHDDHFHMRIACPADSPACETQEPIPPGEGCDASLDWWFQHLPATSPPTPPPPKPRLPQDCQAVLSAP